MVIMLVNGGFANQVYRYACAYATAKKYNQELIIIAQTTDAATDPFQLGEFKIEYSKLYITKSYIEVHELLSKWREKFRIADVYENNYCSMVNDKLFNEYDGIILWGGFQIPLFYEEYIADLRKQFVYVNSSPFINCFSKSIQGKQSVAIHVRRGDFLTYDGACPAMNYYKAAMVFIEDAVGYGRAEYYVFSDDREFVKDFFGDNERIHYVANYGDYKEATEEFIAISMCEHRILTAGSSFSRMADNLNRNEDGYAIYEASAWDSGIWKKKNTVLLQADYITELVKYYAPLFNNGGRHRHTNLSNIETLTLENIEDLCIDAWNIGSMDELKIRMRKIELLNQNGMYQDSIGQVRKLWELSVGTVCESEVHKLYWKSLYEYGYRYESIIEAAYVQDVKKQMDQYYNEHEQRLLTDLSEMKHHEIVMVPSRAFEPHIFEDMLHMGALLRRMGETVTFMFHERNADLTYEKPYNKTLKECDFYTDVMGHSIWCEVVNLTEQIKQYGSLEKYYESYLNSRTDVIFICKRKEDIESIKAVKGNKNIEIFYWDYSNMLDAGNYSDATIIGVVQQKISNDDINYCYCNCDRLLSYDDKPEFSNKLLKLRLNSKEYFEPSTKRSVADYYRIDPNMVYNAMMFVSEINRTSLQLKQNYGGNEMKEVNDSILRKTSELVWSQVYHDTIRGSEWLSQEQPFSPGRGAIGYPVMYVMYRVLNEIRPKSILEMGMGQSTKMIGSYAAFMDGKSRHYVVEHDPEWINFFTNHFKLAEATEIVKCDITDVNVEVDGKTTNITSYVGLKEQIEGKKFDFIFIDGPYGYRSPDYSRVDILDVLPQCLEEQFVIMMDDCDRNGEMNTCNMIMLVLKESGIPYCVGKYSGEKDTIIITSADLKFLCLM